MNNTHCNWFNLWFHISADIYEEVYKSISGLGLDSECEGGGRIIHDDAKKQISVFGYSQVCILDVTSEFTVYIGVNVHLLWMVNFQIF